MKKAKSITLPENLIKWVAKKAKEDSRNFSNYMENLIRKEMKRCSKK